MPRPQLVARMLAQAVRQVRVHDAPDSGAMPVLAKRTFGFDRLLADAPNAASAGRISRSAGLQPLLDQRVCRSVDIEIEAKRQEVIVVDRDQVRGDQRAVSDIAGSRRVCASSASRRP